MNTKILLPIDRFLSEISDKLRDSSNLILQASPGSGKTTRVPPALLSEPWAAGKELWVLVPRRLAAKMAAVRVADEMDEDVGQTVGYQFRFEKIMGAKTRLKFLTEGMLLRLLMNDPTLPRVAAVVLDEFHERHLQTDAALAYLKHLQSSKRPDLKLVVMSATLETQALSAYLDRAPVIALDAPLHPVSVSYLPKPTTERLEFLVREAVQKAISTSQGDILVFLPGMTEIRRAENVLVERYKSGIAVIPLHGDLSKEEQARAFQKFPKPKVILATNIAETSLTFEGVVTVIDSGLHRQASFSWWSGIPTLKTKKISKASAIQRAGRAGRTRPGQCFRLYTQSDFEGRPGFEIPEIQRSDLAQTILEIKNLGVTEFGKFPWFAPPAREATEGATLLLYELGAMTENNLDASLTELGRRMAVFPLHPRLARVMLEAERRKVTEPAAALAAHLSEGDSPNAHKLKSQILGSLAPSSSGSREDVAFSFLAGFPDRVAQKRQGTKGAEIELVLASGGSATVQNCDVVAAADYFVVLDAQERKKQGSAKSSVQVDSLLPIQEEWLLDLSSGLLKESDELEWEARLKKVQQVSRLSYGELVLSEMRSAPQDMKKAADVLLHEGLGLSFSDELSVTDFLKTIEHAMDPEAVEAALTRLKLFGAVSAEIKGNELVALIESAFAGITALNDISPEDLERRFLETQSHETQRKIDTVLPAHVSLKGRRVRVHYRWDQKPWIASRLQDFFGMKQGPTLMGGSLPLTLHLLAPSQRPVQVTQDLASFWKNAYPQIRKELSRKYPRHKWPEDPMTSGI